MSQHFPVVEDLILYSGSGREKGRITIVPRPEYCGVLSWRRTNYGNWVSDELGCSTHAPGHVLDLFMVDAEAFGYQMLIRTGPAEFSEAILTKFNKRGFRSKGGFLYRPDYPDLPPFSFREEEQVFEYLGLSYIAPEERNAEALWR